MRITTPDEWWFAYSALMPLMQQWTGDEPVKTIAERMGDKQKHAELKKFYLTQGDKTIFQVMDELYKEKLHVNAWRILNSIWADLPDHISIHSYAGFGILCDLCSEYWAVVEADRGEDE